ncbi:8657_t:CDS:2 [Cetraspora pellucida]|uniref:8657_t:CDS:1 n=1 Tax=Cetraspora pellucida TaxID=1433469 RepID=A0ACA9LP09_9GLOM|nr:8657_t:CDS:2 [Cetraspora pellucida]
MPSTNHEYNNVYDYRHPLYIGGWRRNVAYIDEDFINDNLDEPHMKRKITILSQYPEIKRLYGYDTITVDITIVGVLVQVTAAYIFGHWLISGNLTMLITSFILGGTMTQIYSIIIHETAHCLAARTEFQNRIVGLIVNIALPIPISMSFRRHHLKHHAFQGVEGIDPELPSEWEKNIHPVAARYIQEHYTFDDGQETYSYYGILNKIFMNVGYHTEHHDFTNVPWTRLPEINKIATEYYENLAYHTSWFMVHWNFVTQRQFGIQSRVKRTFKAHKKGRKMLKILKMALT